VLKCNLLWTVTKCKQNKTHASRSFHLAVNPCVMGTHELFTGHSVWINQQYVVTADVRHFKTRKQRWRCDGFHAHFEVQTSRSEFPANFQARADGAFSAYPMLGGSLVTTAWRVRRLQMEGRPPDTEGSCEYIELAVADSRQGVVL